MGGGVVQAAPTADMRAPVMCPAMSMVVVLGPLPHDSAAIYVVWLCEKGDSGCGI